MSKWSVELMKQMPKRRNAHQIVAIGSRNCSPLIAGKQRALARIQHRHASIKRLNNVLATHLMNVSQIVVSINVQLALPTIQSRPKKG
jgi:hypothetical protein